jgi:tetratricopeptide (TPR) repeat protein
VELLKESLSDTSSEVRFYAHAAMTKIDDAFSQDIKNAEAALDEHDGSSFSALGVACMRYADSGLVEEVMRAQFLEKAVSAFSHAVALSPDDAMLKVRLGSLYLEIGEYAKARECFENVAEGGPGFVEAALGLCKIFYDMRDFDSLYLLRRKLSMADCADCDPAKKIAYNFWSHSKGAS